MIGLPCGGRPSASTVVLDEVQRTSEETYPPYNIERTGESRFQISVALAGFAPDDVTLTVEQNVLTLEGREGRQTLPASRNFRPVVQSGSSRSSTTSKSRAPASRTAS
jgi:HSP20 family molecular chaperone IbpA